MSRLDPFLFREPFIFGRYMGLVVSLSAPGLRQPLGELRSPKRVQ